MQDRLSQELDELCIRLERENFGNIPPFCLEPLTQGPLPSLSRDRGQAVGMDDWKVHNTTWRAGLDNSAPKVRICLKINNAIIQ